MLVRVHVDDDELGEPLRALGGVDEGVLGAGGVADEDEVPEVLGFDDLGELFNVVGEPVGFGGRPGAVAVAAVVEGHDAVALAEVGREEVPEARRVLEAVEQEHGVEAIAAPVKVVEAQAMGLYGPGLGSLLGAHGPPASPLWIPGPRGMVGIV